MLLKKIGKCYIVFSVIALALVNVRFRQKIVINIFFEMHKKISYKLIVKFLNSTNRLKKLTL